MKKKEAKKLYQDWTLVALGTILTMFAGIFINAAYDLAKSQTSEIFLFFTFGVLTFFFINFIFFIIENYKKVEKNIGRGGGYFFVLYLKNLARLLLFWRK